jgi:hypothetical protein
MKQAATAPAVFSCSGRTAPHGVELPHLGYFVAVADAGTFTHAAERMFLAQLTLSHQIRRLAEMLGTPLLQRRRDGFRLTPAETVLLGVGRSMIGHRCVLPTVAETTGIAAADAGLAVGKLIS